MSGEQREQQETDGQPDERQVNGAENQVAVNSSARHIESGGGAVVHGDVQAGRDFVGRDQITYNIRNIIQHPSLWQDALWRFASQHRPFLALALALIVITGVPYLVFRELYLIPFWILLLTGALLITAAWGWYTLNRRALLQPATRTRLGVTALSSLLAVGLIANQAWRIISPASFPPQTFAIALAEVDHGLTPQETRLARDITVEIYDRLCAEIRTEFSVRQHGDPCRPGDALPPITVRRIGRLGDSDTARSFGQRIKADIVIWGRVSATAEGTVFHFNVLETPDQALSPEFPLVLPVATTFENANLTDSDLDLTTDFEDIKDKVVGMTRLLSFFVLGLHAYWDLDFQSAASHLDAGLETLRRDPDLELSEEALSLLYYYLGRSYLVTLRVEEGQDRLHQARILNPGEPAITHSLAQGYAMLGDEQREREYAQLALELLRRWPNHPVALYNQAQIYRVGDVLHAEEIAEDFFHQALAREPDLYPAYLSLARLYYDQGRLTHGDGLVLADDATGGSLSPWVEEARQSLSCADIANLNQERLQNAAAILVCAIDLAHRNELDPVWSYFNLGEVFARAGSPRLAKEAYLLAISHKPDLVALHHRYAEFLAAEGEIDAAAEVYDRLPQLTTNRAWAHEKIGDFWMSDLVGQPAEAAIYYRRAVNERPEDAYLQVRLAEAYYAAGQHAQGRQIYERVMRQAPQGYYPYASYAYALTYYSSEPRDWEQGVRAALKSLSRRPLDRTVLGYFITLSLRLGQAERAEEGRRCLESVELFEQQQVDQSPPDQALQSQAIACVQTLVDG